MPYVLYMQNAVWQLTFWCSFTAWMLIEMWIAGRDRRAASGEKQDRDSKLVIYAMVWSSIAIAFAAPFRVPQARIDLSPASVSGRQSH